MRQMNQVKSALWRTAIPAADRLLVCYGGSLEGGGLVARAAGSRGLGAPSPSCSGSLEQRQLLS